MKRPRAAWLLALALAAACADQPTGPRLAAALEILIGTAPLDEKTIGVGETVRLSASPRDAAGKEIPGRTVRWHSTSSAIATVDDGGSVRGVSAGTALIVATSDATADTVRINVAVPVAGSVSCDPARAATALSVGQIYSTTAWERGTLCLDGGASGAEYLLVPFHAARAAGGPMLPLELAAVGVRPVAEPGAAQLAPLAERDPTATALPDLSFHHRLRERATSGLTRRLREITAAEAPVASRALMAAETPKVGDRLRLNVETRSDDGCTNPVYRTGRVVAVTDRAIVVADTANPAGGFADEDYQAFGAAFDQLVYPLGVESFGSPSDVDRNGRAVIFFTSAVNDLTTAGSGAYVGGFFYDRDLFPRGGRGACAGSNAAEMFYMMVPDPARQAREPVFSRENVRRQTLGVVMHEFQHLINASRRLHVNRAPVWETVWLNEGLSHIAEEILFFHVSGLEPRRNEDGSRLVAEAARQAMIDYQRSNVDRYIQYLGSPHTASPLGGDVLATRGAIWSFLRYAADRRGGIQHALWHRVVNSKTSGLANLNDAFGLDVIPWLHDWHLSVYLDDAELETADRFAQPSWNFRALIPRMRTLLIGSGATRYPLHALSFAADGRLELNLQSGGAGYVRFGVAARQQAAVRITSGGLPGPQKLQLTVVRTK